MQMKDANAGIRCHIYYEQRMLDFPDGIPKWSEMNGHSQQLDDLGQPVDA